MMYRFILYIAVFSVRANPHFEFLDLRHTHLQVMFWCEVGPLREVQELLGHSLRYTHPGEDQENKAPNICT